VDRVTGEDVVSDHIVTGCGKNQNPIHIPADIVALDPVPAGSALEANTEIDISIWIVDAAISVEDGLMNHVLVVLARQTPPHPAPLEPAGVVDPHVARWRCPGSGFQRYNRRLRFN
jgi:hypothetical protein